MTENSVHQVPQRIFYLQHIFTGFILMPMAASTFPRVLVVAGPIRDREMVGNVQLWSLSDDGLLVNAGTRLALELMTDVAWGESVIVQGIPYQAQNPDSQRWQLDVSGQIRSRVDPELVLTLYGTQPGTPAVVKSQRGETVPFTTWRRITALLQPNSSHTGSGNRAAPLLYPNPLIGDLHPQG